MLDFISSIAPDRTNPGGILAMPQFLEYFGNPSNFLQGAITASLLAGSFAGSLLTGAYLTDGIGRKKTLLLGSAVFTLGCILAAAAVNLPMLIAGRVVNGLGNGCLTMTVSKYGIGIDLCSHHSRFPCTKARFLQWSMQSVIMQ